MSPLRFRSRTANVIAHVWGLLLIGLAFASCASAKEPKGPGVCEHVRYVSGVFSPEERQALERANHRWNTVGNEQDCFTTAENIVSGVRRLTYGSPEWQTLSTEFGGQNVLGVYRRKMDAITIVSDLPLDTFELVALHELGHARGLRHVTGGPAVMNAGIGAAYDFTALDMAECGRVGACGESAADADVVEWEDDDVYVLVGR